MQTAHGESGMRELTTKIRDPAPGEIKVWKDRLISNGPEVTLIRVPISSTSEDRDGDNFSAAGLQSMKAALDSGKVPLYLDHGYLPTGARLYSALDMLGAWIAGDIDGETLYGTAFLEPGNPNADRLAQKLEIGLPVGFSVGFGVGKSTRKENGGLVFEQVGLWEVSAVGIPSNPDAVNAAVSIAIKSLRIKAGLEEQMSEKELEEKTQEEEVKEPETPEEEEKLPEQAAAAKEPEEEEEEEEEEKDEDEEEEKDVLILDEAAIRQLVAEEVAKALNPVLDRLKTLDDLKTAIGKLTVAPPAPTKRQPRGIVIAQKVEKAADEPEKPKGPVFIA